MIYIGWDNREQDAYAVCEYSIKKHTSKSVRIKPLKQDELRHQGVYTRSPNEPASTEFAFTRFYIPFLEDFKGWSLFCDCDMLFTEDVRKLFALADDKYAVMVVKHDYTPKTSIKMDGQKQVNYPRKNWSSVILWNCEHPSNQRLIPSLLNSLSAAHLHRFNWLDDKEIGEIPLEWNFLIGEYEPEDFGFELDKFPYPANLHYTLGCPFMEGYENCDYAKLWNRYLEESRIARVG